MKITNAMSKEHKKLDMTHSFCPVCFEAGRQEVLRRARNFNGQIKTVDDLFKHLDRVQKCSNCGKSFWDKPCSDCRKKEVERFEAQAIRDRDKWWVEQVETAMKNVTKDEIFTAVVGFKNCKTIYMIKDEDWQRIKEGKSL